MGLLSMNHCVKAEENVPGPHRRDDGKARLSNLRGRELNGDVPEKPAGNHRPVRRGARKDRDGPVHRRARRLRSGAHDTRSWSRDGGDERRHEEDDPAGTVVGGLVSRRQGEEVRRRDQCRWGRGSEPDHQHHDDASKKRGTAAHGGS